MGTPRETLASVSRARELRAFSRGSSPACFPWNPRSFPSGATRNQIQLMGAGATALYCECLQLGGFSSNASQARQGKNEVNLLRAITAGSIRLQKGKATLLAVCLLDSLRQSSKQQPCIGTVFPTPRIMPAAQETDKT